MPKENNSGYLKKLYIVEERREAANTIN